MNIEEFKLNWFRDDRGHARANLSGGGCFWVCKSGFNDGLYEWNYSGPFGRLIDLSESESMAIEDAGNRYRRMLKSMLPEANQWATQLVN